MAVLGGRWSKNLKYKSLRLDGDTVPQTLKLKGNEWVSLLAVERT